jgi:hypothetical protein
MFIRFVNHMNGLNSYFLVQEKKENSSAFSCACMCEEKPFKPFIWFTNPYFMRVSWMNGFHRYEPLLLIWQLRLIVDMPILLQVLVEQP